MKVVRKLFNKNLLASLTSENAVLQDVRDRILRDGENRLKQLNPYLHSSWRGLQANSGCFCMDENVAFPHGLKHSLIRDLHASQTGIWGIVCLAQHCWWPCMNHEHLVCSIECKPSTVIGKNLKSSIPVKQFQTHKPSIVPNQE